MTHEQLTITVNGAEVKAPAGEILLRVLGDLGIVVPTLCNDPRLTPYGGCRLCLVARRDGRGGLIPACSTPVQRGMVIETDVPEVIAARKRQLQLLALNHRMECPVCERRGDCRFQDLVYEYGTLEEELPFERMKAPRDEKSPVIVRDPEKCILCGKCVRMCEEVQGVAAIGIVHRGLKARVATLLERPLDCEFCGQCVNACPVGALVARPYSSDVPVWHRTAAVTTCSFCSCGCQITVEMHDGTIQRVTSNPEAKPNHGKLCAKGWLGWDVLQDGDRLEVPLVRRDGRLVEAGWDEALAAVAGAFEEARTNGAPIAAVGSPRLTCEDAYLMQRLVRGVLGSPHVDAGPAGGVAALVEGMGRVTGECHSTATFEDLAAADIVLVLRGDPTRTHPLVKTELVQGVRQRGQRVILAHALSGGLERHAEVFLKIEPGREDVLVHGIAAQVLERIGPAADSIRDLPGFAEWALSIADYTPDVVASCTGVSAETVVRVAGILSSASRPVTVVVTGLGIPGDEASVTRAAVWLDAMLRSGQAGGGVLVLGEKANVQGIVDVGLHHGLLPGQRIAQDEETRRSLSELWGGELPSETGWSAKEILSRASRSEVRALLLVGQDPVGTWAQCFQARKAVEGAGFVVVQDAFLTQTARLADVVLPVNILGDRSGTLVGADGVRRPVGRIRPAPRLPQDGEIFVELARRLGSALPSGLDLEGELTRLQRWPHRSAPVRRFEAVNSPIRKTPWAGMLLDVSPQLFHSGSVTRRSRRLQELAPTVAARLSPADARELNLRNGDAIRIATTEGEMLLRARLDRTVRTGTVVVSWQTNGEGSAATLVTEPGRPVGVSVRRSP